MLEQEKLDAEEQKRSAQDNKPTDVVPTALDLGGESEHSESEVGQDRSADASSNRKASKQRSVDGHIAEYCSSRCKGLSFDLFRPIHEKKV